MMLKLRFLQSHCSLAIFDQDMQTCTSVWRQKTDRMYVHQSCLAHALYSISCPKDRIERTYRCSVCVCSVRQSNTKRCLFLCAQ